MHRMLLIHSGERGVLLVNGQFCGPLEEGGQAFPAGRDAEVYVQLFPFGERTPLTAGLTLAGGRIVRLEPEECAYALCWPEGIIQLELRGERTPAQDAQEQAQEQTQGMLMRYLAMRLAGDPQAERLLMRPQDAPDLSGYEAAVALRFPPAGVQGQYDACAGLMRRTRENAAVIDAALAKTTDVLPGTRRIARIDIIRTDG